MAASMDIRLAALADRGVVCVTGEDARKLLQGIVTNDIDLLDSQPAVFTGLLSPQGKIMFEFIVAKSGDDYLLDVATDQIEDLVRRLTMYRLRAKADITDVSDRLRVVAAWPGAAAQQAREAVVSFADPRCPDLGLRRLEAASGDPGPDEGAAAYHAHRIALGIPEGGKDFDFGDAFPHETNFDLNHGVSFTKGCYVGQEIVARMQHRATVRKRIVRVTGASDLPTDRADIKIGDVVIGRLGSVVGRAGLAMLRLDRAIEAIDKGSPIVVAGIALEIDAEMIGRHRALMAQKADRP